MAINKGTIAKEVNGIVEYIYPKTTADIVEYSLTESVKDILDSLNTIAREYDGDIANIIAVIGDENSGIIKDINDLKEVIDNLDIASSTNNGLMSSEDKVKLDGIEVGANRTIVDRALNIESTNPVQNKVITEALNDKADKNHTHTVVNGHTVESDVPVGAKFTDTTYSVATHSKDGLMSSEDKVKIDNINNIIINDNTISNEQTYSSKKINTDYYNKNQVDNIFLQVGWTGTLEQYSTMLIHNPGMVYTTIDNNGNIKRFLGDIEIKNDTIIVGEIIKPLSGISSYKFGVMVKEEGD